MLRSPRLPSSRSWSPRRWKGFRKKRKQRQERLTKEHSGSCRDIRGAVCEENERDNFIRTRPSLWDIDLLRNYKIDAESKSKSSPLKKYSLKPEEKMTTLLCASSDNWSTLSSESDFVPVQLVSNLASPRTPSRTSSTATVFFEEDVKKEIDSQEEEITTWKLHTSRSGHVTLSGLDNSDHVLIKIACPKCTVSCCS